mgnify:CR=1 FL=1
MYYKIQVSIDQKEIYNIEADTQGQAKQIAIRDAMVKLNAVRSDIKDTIILSVCCDAFGFCCVGDKHVAAR